MRYFLDALSSYPTVSTGTQAMILGAMDIFKDSDRSEFVLLSPDSTVEEYYLSGKGFRTKILKRERGSYRRIRQLRRIVRDVDAVLCVWGDGYITTPPNHILRKAIFLKRKGVALVLVTASMGPFRRGLKGWMARKGLAFFDILTTRDVLTQKMIEELGFNWVKLFPDTAFALQACPRERVLEILRQEGAPVKGLIGINTSILLYNLFSRMGMDYLRLMERLIRHTMSYTGREILLIPHQIFPSVMRRSEEMVRSADGDDRWVVDRLLEKGIQGVYGLRGEYQPEEYKGVIGSLEMLIGGRMHSIIASVSMCVPIVLMQYSHKAAGFLKTVELETCMWDIHRPVEELLAVVQKTWDDRSRIGTTLRRRIDVDRQGLAALAGIVQTLLREKGSLFAG